MATDLTRRPGVITVRVARVVRETADAHSLVLEPADGDSSRLSYRPGQFLTIRIPTDRPEGAARCYSLSSSPVCDERPQVTVKRTAGGYGSNWLCDHVSEGDTLEVLRPAGLFTPASLDEDLLLVAAGSGITPVMSICKSVLRAGRGAVSMVYANRDEDSVIFRDALAALAAEHGARLTVIHWLESVQGLPTATGIAGLLRPYAGREAFVCGPAPFMSLVADVLTGLGVPGRRIRLERFESLTADPFAGAPLPPAGQSQDGGPGDSGETSTVEVTLDGQTRTLAWPRGRTLVDVLLQAGLDAPFSCREGSCSACACVLLEGEVEMARNSVLNAGDLAEGLILGCQATPASDRLRITYDG